MNIRQRIARFEREAPARYLAAVYRPWGRMFADTSNPDSHSSNYAVLTGIGPGISRALGEAEAFFRARQLQPKLLHRIDSLPLEVLRPQLALRGYEVYEQPLQLMCCTAAPSPAAAHFCVCEARRLTDAQRSLAGEDYEGDYGVRMLLRQLECPDCRMFFSYEGTAPVSGGMLECCGSVGYLSDVYTTPEYRGRGHAEALVRTMVRCAFERGIRLVYLYVETPRAERLYRRVGFGVRAQVPYYKAMYEENMA